MRINNNIAAYNTHRQLTGNTNAQSKNMEALSSGFRINRAGDDAAGLAISEKMRGQIRGLEMASKNSQDGISLIQTAEGAMNETHAILQRMRELAVQARNDTNTDEDRANLQDEVTQLIQEIDGISERTEFNGMKLISGGFSGAGNELTFQIGANAGQTTALEIGSTSAEALSVDGIDISDASGASGAISSVETAIRNLSQTRSKLGAVQNRLEHTINNLGTSAENLTAAESRIRDVDMAKEMTTLTKNNILAQAATSMLAQANQQPQGVLQLLR